jgi:adenylate kinase family enzyme
MKTRGDLRRVVVLGGSCAGKSTCGRALADRLGVPHIELDALFWLPGWHEPETALFRSKVQEALETSDRWVVSGNYLAKTQDLTWPLADTAIWLDLPLRTTVPRILRRSWRRWRQHELLWGTNHERFWPQLKLWSPKDSLIAYSLRRERGRRRELEALMAGGGYPNLDWVRLRSASEARRWLEGIPS